MQLQNIHNAKRNIYLFERDNTGQLIVHEDNSFYPYFYQKSESGDELAYDGTKVKKIMCQVPGDVGKARNSGSYEADILFPKRYIIDRVDYIKKSPIKYFFFDIEILADEMPSVDDPKYPVSAISLYNSFTKEIKSWFLDEWPDEESMLANFMFYIHRERPDLLLAWNNLGFDYPYLQNRFRDFPKTISPIYQVRYGENKLFYPAGISILDYMTMFKKISMREQSYALDRIAQKHLKEEAWQETKFNVLDEVVKKKNINDVERMVKLEEKFQIIDYFDEIRRFAGCLWEDLTANSKVLDVYVLREAKKRHIILPNRVQDNEHQQFEGAYRRADEGVYYSVYKADVASMYPNQLINFCLDARNIVNEPGENVIDINGVFVKQDSEALLPAISQDLIGQKDSIKAELKKLDYDSKEYENVKKKYDAIKGLVNSLYGVMAFPTFRLFNFTIASTITYLARDLLRYVERMMIEEGCKVHYTDTDALMYESEDNEDEIEFINRLVHDWALVQYNKKNVTLEFESEGKFTKLLILGKCHYYGFIEGKEKPEIKGMEIKRSSSSKFEAQFQEELINKILNKESKKQILDWIRSEIKRIRTLPLIEVGFPCKLANRVYKNEPMFFRAYNNSVLLDKSFSLGKGELYYYTFTRDLGYDKNKKPINVLAFTETYIPKGIEKKLDWDAIIQRNIIAKVVAIFKMLKWGDAQVLLSSQLTLF